MRLFKGLLFIALVLGAVYALGGWLLPDRAEVKRSVVIERAPGEVYALLDGFARFNEWSPWRDYDATARYEFAGPATGVGAILRWQGEKGQGAQEIVAMDPPHSIAVELDFGSEGKAMSRFHLRPAGTATRLIWRLESDAGGAFGKRWVNLLLERMVGPDFERGLADLKALAEASPPPAAALPDPPAAPQEPLEDEAAEAGAAAEAPATDPPTR